MTGEIIRGVFVPHDDLPQEAKATLIFHSDDVLKEKKYVYRPARKVMSEEEGEAFVEKYSGCLKGIDPDAEKWAYMEEKYGPFN